jgi:hypothetical protein
MKIFLYKTGKYFLLIGLLLLFLAFKFDYITINGVTGVESDFISLAVFSFTAGYILK